MLVDYICTLVSYYGEKVMGKIVMMQFCVCEKRRGTKQVPAQLCTAHPAGNFCRVL